MNPNVEISENTTQRDPGRLADSTCDQSLHYLLLNWVRQSYDELGKLVLANGILFVTATLAIAPPYLLLNYTVEGTPFFPMGSLFACFSFLGAWLILCVWFAINSYLDAVFTFRYPTWRESIAGMGKYAGTSLLALTVLGGGMGLVTFNLWVYPIMLPDRPWFRFVAMGLTFWVGLFLALVQVHLIPFLVHQDRSFLTALKRAARVAIWKPVRTLTILLIQMLFIALCLMPPLWLLVPSLYAALSNLSLLILLEDWKDPYRKTPEAIRAGA